MLDQHLNELDSDDQVQCALQEMSVCRGPGAVGQKERKVCDEQYNAQDKTNRDDDRDSDLKDIHHVFKVGRDLMETVSLFIVIVFHIPLQMYKVMLIVIVL